MIGVSVVCNFTGVIIHDFGMGLDIFCLSIRGELLALTFHLKGDFFFQYLLKKKKCINIRLKITNWYKILSLLFPSKSKIILFQQINKIYSNK